MLPFNTFINTYLPTVRKFLDDIANVSPDGDETSIIIQTSPEEKKGDWETIYRFIFKDYDNIKKKIEESKICINSISTLDFQIYS